jgi:ketosteroid isomerase-like protein
LDTDRAKALIEQFLDAYNRFEIEGMVELVDPEIEFRNVSGGDLDTSAIGKDEFRELAEQSAFLFSSRRQTPTNFQVDDEVATVDIDFTGTLATDIPDGPKAGEELHVTGRSEFEFRDDKIYRLTDYS